MPSSPSLRRSEGRQPRITDHIKPVKRSASTSPIKQSSSPTCSFPEIKNLQMEWSIPEQNAFQYNGTLCFKWLFPNRPGSEMLMYSLLWMWDDLTNMYFSRIPSHSTNWNENSTWASLWRNEGGLPNPLRLALLDNLSKISAMLQNKQPVPLSNPCKQVARPVYHRTRSNSSNFSNLYTNTSYEQTPIQNHHEYRRPSMTPSDSSMTYQSPMMLPQIHTPNTDEMPYTQISHPMAYRSQSKQSTASSDFRINSPMPESSYCGSASSQTLSLPTLPYHQNSLSPQRSPTTPTYRLSNLSINTSPPGSGPLKSPSFSLVERNGTAAISPTEYAVTLPQSSSSMRRTPSRQDSGSSSGTGLGLSSPASEMQVALGSRSSSIAPPPVAPVVETPAPKQECALDLAANVRPDAITLERTVGSEAEAVVASVEGVGRVILDGRYLEDHFGMEIGTLRQRTSDESLRSWSESPSDDSKPLYTSRRKKFVWPDLPPASAKLVPKTPRSTSTSIQDWLEAPDTTPDVENASRDAWSTLPPRPEDEDDVIPDCIDDDGESMIVISKVGGKSVKNLLVKKRKYEEDQAAAVAAAMATPTLSTPNTSHSRDVLEDSPIGHDDDDTSDYEEGKLGKPFSSRMSSRRKRRGLFSSPLKKARSSPLRSTPFGSAPTVSSPLVTHDCVTDDNSDLVACICSHDAHEMDKEMIQCNGCSIWYHVDCYHVSQEEQVAPVWHCFKCLGQPISTPKTHYASVDMQSHRTEPIFSAASWSPIARANTSNEMLPCPSLVSPSKSINTPTSSVNSSPYGPHTPRIGLGHHRRSSYGLDTFTLSPNLTRSRYGEKAATATANAIFGTPSAGLLSSIGRRNSGVFEDFPGTNIRDKNDWEHLFNSSLSESSHPYTFGNYLSHSPTI